MQSNSWRRVQSVSVSMFLIATGAAVFWLLVAIPRETTVFLVERGPITWITRALWLTALLLAVRYLRGIRRFWREDPVLVGVGTLLLLASMLMDRVQKSMQDRGPTGDRYVLGIGEEIVEVLVPVFFILALLQIGARIRESITNSDSPIDDRID